MPTPKKDLAPIDSALQKEVTEWASKLSDAEREEYASKFPCANVTKRCVGDALERMELLRGRNKVLTNQSNYAMCNDHRALARDALGGQLLGPRLPCGRDEGVQ